MVGASVGSPRPLIRLPAVAITVATMSTALLAGCGDHTATRRDVVARANAICFDAQQTLRELAPPTGGAGDLAGMSRYLGKVVPIVAKESRQLQALPRPASQRGTLDRFVDAVASSVADYRAAAHAAAGGDGAGVAESLAKLRSVDVAAPARAYGLDQCTGETRGAGRQRQ